ncbi:MAG: hypothetical protein CMI53_03875 [Parcubacteria group bacterium]|nr:hypothetical protein [Parcubacteria group bacterium]|tara:strand:- start:1768 stop:3000 length:1233 start_codon:yes stop_codon:yes gene_type:complete
MKLKRDKLIKKTKSTCPVCLDEISANIFEENGKAVMEKRCEQHGEFEAVIENDVDFYKEILKKKPKFEINRDSVIIPIAYGCNLSCKYCYLPDREHKELTTEEIKSYIDNPGYSVIAFSGGEATLNPDIFDLIKYATLKGKETCLLTNGIKLASEDYVKNLKNSGLEAVLFSFNSFDDNKLEKIDSKRLLQTKLKALKNLKREKIKITFSFSWLKGTNDKDFIKALKFALNNNNVFEFRCRVYAMIGRYTQTQDNTLSDFIKLMAKETNIPSDDYFNYWLGLGDAHQNSPDYHSQYLFHINYYDFIFSTKLAKRLRSSIFTYPKYLTYLIEHFGFLYFLRITYAHFSRKKIPELSIRMFSWPDKNDIDLNEVRHDNLDHVALDGSSNPFFETMMLNERIRTRLKKESPLV